MAVHLLDKGITTIPFGSSPPSIPSNLDYMVVADMQRASMSEHEKRRGAVRRGTTPTSRTWPSYFSPATVQNLILTELHGGTKIVGPLLTLAQWTVVALHLILVAYALKPVGKTDVMVDVKRPPKTASKPLV